VLTQAYLGSPFGGGLWGQKTHSIFMYGSTITSGYGKGTVKTAVSLYLNKYMSKESGAVLGVRRFGASKNITQDATSKRKARQGTR
jgi:hypothetical protein